MKTDQNMSFELAIALGSNLGDRQRNLSEAVNRLEHAIGRVTAKSKIYVSHPVGNVDQEFMNAVVLVQTQLNSSQWMGKLLAIESEMGRVRTAESGNRIIDLDVVLAQQNEIGLVFDEIDLLVPHPRAHEREFVMLPLADVASQWQWPQLGITVAFMAKTCPSGQVLRTISQW
jgi:2-amino-4-hydroxy-6-hydroxymethyldihydropteridine diphosphokinase